MVSYYDRVLVGIAASVLAGGLVGALSSVAVHEGIAAGSLVATLFVYAGAFRNPPITRTDPRVRYAAVAWHLVPLVLTLSLVW